MPFELIPQLGSAAIRSSGIGLIIFAGLLVFRIRSAAARHSAWTVVLTGMILQIPFGVIAPTVPLKVLPALPASIEPHLTESLLLSQPVVQTLPPARVLPTAPRRTSVSWGVALSYLYLAISTLLLIRMALGYRGLRRLLQNAKPISGLGPGIFGSDLLVMPGSVGCFRPRIILPRAWRDWSGQKLRAVLAHETAHIRRRDWLIRAASQVNVCLFWFHPLAWWVDRELARLAEEACDDAALSEVEDRDEYAAALLEIAQAASGAPTLNWQVLSMAKGSNVIRRMNRILDGALPVPKPIGRFVWMTLFACALPVIYLSAAVRLTPAVRGSAAVGRDATSASSAERKTSSSVIAQAAPPQPLISLQPRVSPGREDPPITMCILIDNSGSMREKRASVTAAALALVNASRPGDEVCVTDFNDEMFNALPDGKDFTSDISEMKQALMQIDSRGGTAMRDAIRMSIDHVKQTGRNNRKVIVMITEGDDTSSTVTQEQLIDIVRSSGVPVYSIGLLNEDDPDQAVARLALGELAKASGGLDYYARTLPEVDSISLQVAGEMRKR